jgi:predicted DNA-binding transcriptional regulator AlpA
MLGIRPRTLAGYRRAGEGPPYVQIGTRRVKYRRQEVLAWAESRLRISPLAPIGVIKSPVGPSSR